MPTVPLRLNLGCGDFQLPFEQGWVNIDSSRRVRADLHLDVVACPLPFDDDSVEEVYAGHLLEHVPHDDVPGFLAEVRRVLRPGGRLGVVVPDTYEVCRRYVMRAEAPAEWPQHHYRDLRDLDELCAMILFSTEQESPHRWAYDRKTLVRTLTAAGFAVRAAIAEDDPRISVPVWWQFGVDCYKPEAAR